jgi:hypothetical protein
MHGEVRAQWHMASVQQTTPTTPHLASNTIDTGTRS